MDFNTFRSALCYRFMLQYPGMINGARCDCKAQTVLDPTAHHLATACGTYGYRKDAHDSVVLELQYALQYCGFWIKREERDCFLMADPNDRGGPYVTVTVPVCGARFAGPSQSQHWQASVLPTAGTFFMSKPHAFLLMSHSRPMGSPATLLPNLP
jgi:hypothetical protein